MIHEGLIREAFVALRSIHDRYDGIKRNPWNEIEGSDHDSRAMHSWNVLLSLSGFVYDGPAGKLRFAPRLTPEQFKCFFSTSEGWGSISQRVADGCQQETIEIKWGRLRLNQLSVSLSEGLKSPAVKVTKNGNPVPCSRELSNGDLVLTFDPEQTLE